MSDETARLHLAQLASLQELNAVTWNEALAQIDALVDLCLLGQFVNAPPASPQDGDAYLVGGTPTGAWTGYAYKIASCLDGAWRFTTPFNGLRAYVTTTSAFIVYLGGVWTDWNSLISANEVSIASAATCDLGAAGALFVQITDNTTITSFGTGTNKLRFVRFAQALTLTHNAASLILLGGASRTTAAGDVGVYGSDAGGNWRERSYFRAATNPADFATRTGATMTTTTLAGTTTLPASSVITDAGLIGVGTTPGTGFFPGSFAVINSANSYSGNFASYGLFQIGAYPYNDYPFAGYNLKNVNGTPTYVGTDYAAWMRYARSGKLETFTAASGTGGTAITPVAGPYVANGGTSWTSPSDASMKTDIVPLDVISRLRAHDADVGFEFNWSVSGKHDVGAIAQLLQPVFAELVVGGLGDTLGVNYAQSGIVSLQGVFQLLKLADTAQSRIASLEARVAALETK